MKLSLKLESVSVHKILLGLIFLLLLVWGYAPVLREDCTSLPEHQVGEGIVIVPALAPSRPGFICARAYNNLDAAIALPDIPGFRLEKSWIWPLWFPYVNLRDFLPSPVPRIGIGFTLALRSIAAGGYQDSGLPVSLYPASPGKYRVCLVYRKPEDKKKSRACSAAFWLR
jgi:hypothetical protein